MLRRRRVLELVEQMPQRREAHIWIISIISRLDLRMI
jgi:hypothetical protein